MKKIISILFFVTALSAQAQVKTYDYLFFCDQMMANTNNSVSCLQKFYRDLNEFKKHPSFQFRYFDSYNCIRQPDQKAYDEIKGGATTFYKTTDNQLWKLYNDCYAKNGEIVAYIRLQDYKTDLEKGFTLLKEMQQLQIAMGKARDQIAGRIANEAKALPASGSLVKPYQFLMKAVLHEEELIRHLSQNFNEDTFVGYPQAEILKSFLETDDLLKTANFTNLPDRSYYKNCVEGLQLIQQTKQHSLDNFTNTSTLDGEYLNRLYDNLQNYFNNDILHFYSSFCAEARVNYYPVALRKYDFNSPPQPWPLTHLNYSLASLDSLAITKQPAALPTAGFKQLNDIVFYIDECVRSMGNLFKELRSEESTWNSLREGEMPYRNPIIKFDKFTIPISVHGLIVKESNHLPAVYRKNLLDRVNDLQQIMLALQDQTIELSEYMSSGAFRGKDIGYIDTKLETIEKLYTALDARKEKLFIVIRNVYASYSPRKTNSWTVSASALLKATDDSRKILRQMEWRVYEQNESPISTTAIHDDQRDLIINQLKYMNGIVRIGKNNGLCPYNPYEYIPGYLKTVEEKVADFPSEVENKNKTYGDFLYMHNIIVEQYNKFAELGLGSNEYSANDAMRPVYLLSYIRQPPRYSYEKPKPKAVKEEPPIESVPIAEVAGELISFEGYPFNNLVLLLDVSASMNKPERLPLLKKSFQQLIRFMRKEDEVSIVIYSGKATLQLAPLSASDTTTIMHAIENLRSEGKTNISDGLTLAYKTANRNFIEGGNNRIIMATDGEFNTSESLYKQVEKNSPDILLSVFDFSEREEIVKPIQLLAEKGNGNYIKATTKNLLQALANETRKESQ